MITGLLDIGVLEVIKFRVATLRESVQGDLSLPASDSVKQINNILMPRFGHDSVFDDECEEQYGHLVHWKGPGIYYSTVTGWRFSKNQDKLELSNSSVPRQFFNNKTEVKNAKLTISE